ncbi:MAG: hypothetical protein LBT92_02090 [Rickettsiales bacterium]|jgi:hypothetical protein|nr:hypothetical protein [Rickettsiales bacterium]
MMNAVRKIKRFWRVYGRLAKLALAFATLSWLVGCTASTSGDFCILYRPVYADYGLDTAETVAQIDLNNVVYDALCAARTLP